MLPSWLMVDYAGFNGGNLYPRQDSGNAALAGRSKTARQMREE
jgi:hypothetical protein